MLATTIGIIFQVYTLMLFARIISSWVPELQETKAIRFIAFYTDPYLNIFRNVIPPIGFLDISPIFAFLALQLMQMLLLNLVR